MKKFILTISMTGMFLIYLVYQRISGTAATTPPPIAIVTPTPAPVATGKFKNGTYTGTSADAYYGYIQVQAVVSEGELSDVQFLDYPSGKPESVEINSWALPVLRSEAISAQSANVNLVSRATDSSKAFIESLSSALAQAKF